jgi:DNA-binding response OmpR family regulator
MPAPRVLVLDDDPMIQGILTRVLSRSGFEVRCASDGEAGWEELQADHYDLLITDNEMPRLTGVDLLRRLRETASHLPTILISGNMPWQVQDLPDLLPPGAAIEKPFVLSELMDKARNLLALGQHRHAV